MNINEPYLAEGRWGWIIVIIRIIIFRIISISTPIPVSISGVVVAVSRAWRSCMSPRPRGPVRSRGRPGARGGVRARPGPGMAPGASLHQAVEDQAQGAVVQARHLRPQQKLRLLLGAQKVEHPQLPRGDGGGGERVGMYT